MQRSVRKLSVQTRVALVSLTVTVGLLGAILLALNWSGGESSSSPTPKSNRIWLPGRRR